MDFLPLPSIVYHSSTGHTETIAAPFLSKMTNQHSGYQMEVPESDKSTILAKVGAI